MNKMCDKFIDILFNPQRSLVQEKFFLEGSSIGFIGKDGKELTLSSNRLNASITGSVGFEVIDKMCIDSIVFLSTKAKITIEKLVCGPYRLTNDEIIKEDLYIQIFNLVIFMDLKYFFNPLAVCKKDFQDLLGESLELIKFRNYFKEVTKKSIYHKRYYTTNGGLIMDVDKQKGITIEKVYISDGLFGPPDEELTSLVEPLIKNYSSQFAVFYDIILVGIAELSIFSDLIRNEFLRVYCIYQKTNPYIPPKLEDLEKEEAPPKDRTIPVVPTTYGKDKIARIKKLGWKSVITNK
jgi:hypothetical protein